MSLLTKPTDLRERVLAKKQESKRGDELVHAFYNHIEAVNSLDYYPIVEVEEILLAEQQRVIKRLKEKPSYPMDLPRFSPSSADKCERELFFKGVKADKDEETAYPFQRRWTRNSTAVHGAMQKQLLEAEFVLDKSLFKVVRLDNGLPAWERNIETFKIIEHNGVKFILYGMCDGILQYKDGSKVGFEFKTKTNSVTQIKQLKEPSPSHRLQTVAYSILFGVDEWLITYEAVAKDKWSAGADARQDFKVFYNKVTDADRKRLLDKLARVAENIETGEVSKPDFNKCLFCPFKETCKGLGL
jgi:hypothetical protein